MLTLDLRKFDLTELMKTNLETYKIYICLLKRKLTKIYNDFVSIENELIHKDHISSDLLLTLISLKEKSHSLQAEVNEYDRKFILILNKHQESFVNKKQYEELIFDLKKLKEEINEFFKKTLIVYNSFNVLPSSLVQ